VFTLALVQVKFVRALAYTRNENEVLTHSRELTYFTSAWPLQC